MSLKFPISLVGKRGGAPSFDPLPYSPLVWLDAKDTNTIYDSDVGGSVITDGGTVGRWEDKSGNGNDFTRGNSLYFPTYTASDSRAFNQPSIGQSSSAGIIGLKGPLLGIREWFIVVAYKDGLDTIADTYQHILGGTLSNSKPRFMTNSGTVNTLGGVFIKNYTDGDTFSSTGLLPLPLTVLRCRPENGSVVYTDTFTLGYGQANSGRVWDGPICEVLAFADEVSNADAEAITNGLKSKWGLNDAPTLLSNINFTGYTSGSQTVSSSTVLSESFAAWKAYDNSAGTSWLTAGGLPNWMKIDFGSAVNCTRIVYNVRNDTAGIQSPRNYVVESSDDDTNWTLRSTVTEAVRDQDNNITHDFDDQTGSARYWRITFTTHYGENRIGLETLMWYGF